jgi:hypothetical protein
MISQRMVIGYRWYCIKIQWFLQALFSSAGETAQKLAMLSKLLQNTNFRS